MPQFLFGLALGLSVCLVLLYDAGQHSSDLERELFACEIGKKR